jgi:hypothetical protein
MRSYRAGENRAMSSSFTVLPLAYQARGATSDGINLRPSHGFSIGPFGAVVVRFSVCLTCGFIAPYIGDGDIKVFRGLKENERRKRDATGSVDKR